jgi:hypothetical protein
MYIHLLLSKVFDIRTVVINFPFDLSSLQQNYFLFSSHLMEILRKSLDLASNATPSIPPNVTALKLNESISAIYTLLKRYRDHEAREILCEELRKQVENAKIVELNFRKCLETNQQCPH